MSQLDDGHSQPPSIARSRLSVRAVGDIESLVALAPTWNVLLERSRSNTIFLTWEWVYTWWQIYGEGRRLHVLVVEGEAVGIVGIAPLMKVRSRVLGLLPVEEARFIGDGGDVTPEYLDLFDLEGSYAMKFGRFDVLMNAEGHVVGSVGLLPIGDIGIPRVVR